MEAPPCRDRPVPALPPAPSRGLAPFVLGALLGEPRGKARIRTPVRVPRASGGRPEGVLSPRSLTWGRGANSPACPSSGRNAPAAEKARGTSGRRKTGTQAGGPQGPGAWPWGRWCPGRSSEARGRSGGRQLCTALSDLPTALTKQALGSPTRDVFRATCPGADRLRSEPPGGLGADGSCPHIRPRAFLSAASFHTTSPWARGLSCNFQSRILKLWTEQRIGGCVSEIGPPEGEPELTRVTPPTRDGQRPAGTAPPARPGPRRALRMRPRASGRPSVSGGESDLSPCGAENH